MEPLCCPLWPPHTASSPDLTLGDHSVSQDESGVSVTPISPPHVRAVITGHTTGCPGKHLPCKVGPYRSCLSAPSADTTEARGM